MWTSTCGRRILDLCEIVWRWLWELLGHFVASFLEIWNPRNRFVFKRPHSNLAALMEELYPLKATGRRRMGRFVGLKLMPHQHWGSTIEL